MGKPLIQQRRGKGSGRFRKRSFRAPGAAKIPAGVATGEVLDIIGSNMHSAPLLKLRYGPGTIGYLVAPEGIAVGDTLTVGFGEIQAGVSLPLKDIPVGTTVHNVESQPGDGGRFARGSGAAARVLAQQSGKVVVLLPSKKRKEFHPECRATLGTVAGGGRLEKPLMKAGKKHHKVKSKNTYWPLVSGAAMNAVAHPFGGKRSSRKGRPTIAPKNAPPGRMVGMIRPRKTGRARGTRVRKS